MRTIALLAGLLLLACGSTAVVDAGSGGGAATSSAANGAGGTTAGAGGGSAGSGGDGSCDRSAFVGRGIATDGWGAGDYCDTVTACAEQGAADELAMLFSAVTCVSFPECPSGLGCVIWQSGRTISEADDANLCSAAEIDGVDYFECLLLGP